MPTLFSVEPLGHGSGAVGAALMTWFAVTGRSGLALRRGRLTGGLGRRRQLV